MRSFFFIASLSDQPSSGTSTEHSIISFEELDVVVVSLISPDNGDDLSSCLLVDEEVFVSV